MAILGSKHHWRIVLMMNFMETFIEPWTMQQSVSPVGQEILHEYAEKDMFENSEPCREGFEVHFVWFASQNHKFQEHVDWEDHEVVMSEGFEGSVQQFPPFFLTYIPWPWLRRVFVLLEERMVQFVDATHN